MKCFADAGVRCDALVVKECEGCSFYKPLDSQIEVFLEDMKVYKGIISNQSYKTIAGQAKAGDLIGARRGFEIVKKRSALI